MNTCKNLNRNFILIEKEQEYIDIINKRLEVQSPETKQFLAELLAPSKDKAEEKLEKIKEI